MSPLETPRDFISIFKYNYIGSKLRIHKKIKNKIKKPIF